MIRGWLSWNGGISDWGGCPKTDNTTAYVGWGVGVYAYSLFFSLKQSKNATCDNSQFVCKAHNKNSMSKPNRSAMWNSEGVMPVRLPPDSWIFRPPNFSKLF